MREPPRCGGAARAVDPGWPVIVDGMLYFNSGYSKGGGNTGNVLLAFGPSDGD